MAYNKTFVCFANSRKNLGSCIAGKEWVNGAPGGWVRPVSSRATHEVADQERQFRGGGELRLLDVISVPCSSHQPLPNQVENHVLDPSSYWVRRGVIAWADINRWTDSPESLWSLGDGSYAYQNNRVADGYSGGTSLYLIVVDALQVIVGPKSSEFPKRIVRGQFIYRGITYRMTITDPVMEQYYLHGDDGQYTISNPKLCVSLGDPYQGYFYKLIAAVLYRERFE
jgi:hypothetical protein